MNMVNETNKVQ